MALDSIAEVLKSTGSTPSVLLKDARSFMEVRAWGREIGESQVFTNPLKTDYHTRVLALVAVARWGASAPALDYVCSVSCNP